MFEKIERYYRKNQLLPEAEIEKMMYAIRSIWNDLMKFLIMLGLACMLKELSLYLWVVAVYTSCRVFLGGVHKKTFWGCTVVTMVQIFALIYLAHLVVCYDVDLVRLSGASTGIVLGVGSVVSSEKRKVTEEKKRWFTFVSFGIEVAWMIVAWNHRKMVIQQGIYLAILLDNLQVVMAKYYENKRKELKRA